MEKGKRNAKAIKEKTSKFSTFLIGGMLTPNGAAAAC